MSTKRVLVIGLDCATPQFIFGEHAFNLPTLRNLMKQGCWGPLKTCHPPITVPAWAVMMTGKDPGVLGVYGFRNRADYSYDKLATATGTAIQEPRIWDILSQYGKKSVVLAVPQTYPPKPINGWLVAGFLTPNPETEYTYPRSLKAELEKKVGEYIIDVKDFRTNDKKTLLSRIYDLMENRFAQAEFLIQSKPWDFFIMVEMGMDRLHHAFWKFADPQHPMYIPNSEFCNAIRDYYEAVDQKISQLLRYISDDTAVLVVSDHGARAMHGGIAINEWLIRNGYLKLKNQVVKPTRIEDCQIDWEHTYAWGSGGYYGRIFLNVQGREPNGKIPPSAYAEVQNKLIQQIESMTGPDGKLLGNRAYKPQELYKETKGIPPDLLVYFGDLAWRSVGSVGFPDVFTYENDTGPDDANHDFYGIFIFKDNSSQKNQQYEMIDILDVAPTILNYFDIPIPSDMQGHILKEKEG